MIAFPPDRAVARRPAPKPGLSDRSAAHERPDSRPPRDGGGGRVAAAPPAVARCRRPRPHRRFPPEVLSQAEIGALLKACGPESDPIAARHRALIAVLYRTGLRITEALSLRPKDLELDAGAIRVLRAKGGAYRTVGIDAAGTAYLRAWLDRRAALGVGGPSAVFCTLAGRPLAPAYIRRLLRRLGLNAGIERRVHAHGLRHTHAAELRAEGVDIGIICKQLGHRSIATTARYLDHIAPVAVVEAIARRTW